MVVAGGDWGLFEVIRFYWKGLGFVGGDCGLSGLLLINIVIVKE